MSERRTVNVIQASALARVSRRTIYYWIATGKIACAPKARYQDSARIYRDSLPRPRWPDLTPQDERCIISPDEAQP